MFEPTELRQSNNEDHIDVFIDELILYILTNKPHFDMDEGEGINMSSYKSMDKLRTVMRESIIKTLSSSNNEDFGTWYFDWIKGNPDNEPDFKFEFTNTMMEVVIDIFGDFQDGSEFDNCADSLLDSILKMCKKHYEIHPELLPSE